MTSAGPNGAVPGGYLPQSTAATAGGHDEADDSYGAGKEGPAPSDGAAESTALREQRQQQQQHMLAEQVSATDSAQLLFKILIWNSHTCQCASSCLTLRSFGVQISVIIDKGILIFMHSFCFTSLFFTQLQQQQHLPRQMSQAQRNPYPLQQFQGKTHTSTQKNIHAQTRNTLPL